MHLKTEKLAPELIEQMLTKLGFSEPPSVDLDGLTSLYGAWCRKVPFDNIRKRIHLAANDPRPLPGDDDTEFFKGWLRYGVGGTCWAGNAALHALLDTLGFLCERGTATMLTDSQQPPNHGTVSVYFDHKQYLVDASMMHNTPLILDPNKRSEIKELQWGLSSTPHLQQWIIQWRPLHMPDGCNCRIEQFPVSRDTFRQLNEVSRTLSPFNDSLYFRLNGQKSVLGISHGMAINIPSTGIMNTTPISHDHSIKLLIDKMGISEEIAVKIPHDHKL